MTNTEATQILREQILSLVFLNDKTYDSWHTQTKSVIRDFFGFTSEEYNFINRFSFTKILSDLPVLSQITQSKPTAIDFLERCIKTIERKQLFKPPEPIIKYVEKPVIKEVIRNIEVIKEVIKEVIVPPKKVNVFLAFFRWVKRRDVLAFITTALAVLAMPFWLGWSLSENKGEIKNIELRRENSELKADTTYIKSQNRKLIDSLRVNASLNITKTKADDSTKSDQKQKLPQTSHK